MNSELDKMNDIYIKCSSNLNYNSIFNELSNKYIYGKSIYSNSIYIYDWLILGNLYDALYFKGEAILSVFDEYYKYTNCFSHKDWGYIDIKDDDSNIIKYFQVAFDFLDRVHNENKMCIVHCTNEKNLNRSASIVFAYYLYKSTKKQNNKEFFYDVYEFLNMMKPCIINNINFRRQLISWAKENNILY
jgi:hypothetical protein